MLVLVILGVVVSAVALIRGGVIIGRWRGRLAASAPPSPDRDGEREEGRLASALIAGDIPLVWYRQRMAHLAARDDADHPGDSAAT
jgi:hypothetical protein